LGQENKGTERTNRNVNFFKWS